MAERKENSVLFSLNELRSIEEERQQEVVDSKRRAEEDRVRSQQDAERRAREAAEAQRRAAEDAERAIRENAERQAREERMRLEEAERRARVEAQAALEQQRLSQEMQIRAMEASKKRPVALVVLAGVMVVACAGLAIFVYKRNQEADRQEMLANAEVERYRAQAEKETAELNVLVNEQKQLVEQLSAAKSAEETRKAQEAIAAKQRQIDAQNAAIERTRKAEADRRRATEKQREKVKIKCDPNDPLCGM